MATRQLDHEQHGEKKHEHAEHKKPEISAVHKALDLASPEVARAIAQRKQAADSHVLPHEVGQQKLPTIDVGGAHQHSSRKPETVVAKLAEVVSKAIGGGKHDRAEHQPHRDRDEKPRARDDERPKSREADKPKARDDEKPKGKDDDKPKAKDDDKPKAKDDDKPKGKDDDKPKAKDDDKPKAKDDEKPKGKDDDKPKANDDDKPKGKDDDKPKGEDKPQGEDKPKSEGQRNPEDKSKDAPVPTPGPGPVVPPEAAPGAPTIPHGDAGVSPSAGNAGASPSGGDSGFPSSAGTSSDNSCPVTPDTFPHTTSDLLPTTTIAGTETDSASSSSSGTSSTTSMLEPESVLPRTETLSSEPVTAQLTTTPFNEQKPEAPPMVASVLPSEPILPIEPVRVPIAELQPPAIALATVQELPPLQSLSEHHSEPVLEPVSLQRAEQPMVAPVLLDVHEEVKERETFPLVDRRVQAWTPEYEAEQRAKTPEPPVFYDQLQPYFFAESDDEEPIRREPLPEAFAERDPSGIQKAIAQAIAADPNNPPQTTNGTNTSATATPGKDSDGSPSVGSGFVGEIDPNTVLPGMDIITDATKRVPLDINTILQHSNDKDVATHKVKEGQTLEEIAREHFGDERYADLIFRMNLNQIPAKFVGMRKLRVHLLPNTKLRLPTRE